jgi:hypothetical protein
MKPVEDIRKPPEIAHRAGDCHTEWLVASDG